MTTYPSERDGLNLRDAKLEQHDDASISVREALGREKVGSTLYEIEEGRQLWPYHFHWNNEEWLVGVDGAPTLRTPEGERELRAGDLVSFPEGELGAHTLRGPARKVGWGPPWKRLYFPAAAAVDYWEGE